MHLVGYKVVQFLIIYYAYENLALDEIAGNAVVQELLAVLLKAVLLEGLYVIVSLVAVESAAVAELP